MRKFLLLILVSLCLNSLCYAEQSGGGVKSITEEDGAPDVYPWQLKLPNGSVTDNSDGTASISLSGSYQPLATILTTLSALANSSGALTNNGTGTLSWVTYLTAETNNLETVTTGIASTEIPIGTSAGVATYASISGDASMTNAGVLGVNKTRLNVRNETGVQIASTKAVYASGFNNLPLISLADNTDETKHSIVGLTIAPINHEANGFIAVSGQCDAETNSWNVGDTLYLSTSGALTNVMPTSGAVKIIGIVTVKGNYPTGKVLVFQRLEEHILAGGSATDLIIRMGDAIGVNKVSFRDYANSEVAYMDSDGNLTIENLYAVNIWVQDGGVGQLGYDTVDGELRLYSEQAPGTDYIASLFANTAMTSAASFYLPADEPTGESFIKMGTDGIMDFDTATYQASDADLTDLADGSLTASKVAGVADADYGEITVSSGVWSVENAAVIGKVITGFTSGAGALAGTDTILQAVQKLDGNIGTKQATVTEGSLADSVIVSADIKDGEIVTGDLSATAGITLAQTAMTAGRSLTISTNDVSVDAETYIYVAKIAFETPVAGDDFFFDELTSAVTFTKIYAKTLVGTVDFDITIAGSDINGTDITATTAGVLDDNLGGDTTGAVGEEVKLEITSVASAPTYIMIILTGTYDD
jgi:hypothetical protein